MTPDFFKALSDPNRIALLVRLAAHGGAATVSEVAPCCAIDLSVVSRHLATLRAAGILDARKRGREVLYSIRYGELVDILRSLAAALENCCPPDEADIDASPAALRPHLRS